MQTRFAIHMTTITESSKAANRSRTYCQYMPMGFTAEPAMAPDGTYGIVIKGTEEAGRELATYVLPRLASGLYMAGIVNEDEALVIESLPVH